MCVLRTGLSQWEVIPGVVDAQHRVVVGGHTGLWRRALVQRAVLGFSIKMKTQEKLSGHVTEQVIRTK